MRQFGILSSTSACACLLVLSQESVLYPLCVLNQQFTFWPQISTPRARVRHLARCRCGKVSAGFNSTTLRDESTWRKRTSGSYRELRCRLVRRNTRPNRKLLLQNSAKLFSIAAPSLQSNDNARAASYGARYHKQLCGKDVCPHGTVCGRPRCPRAKMFYGAQICASRL